MKRIFLLILILASCSTVKNKLNKQDRVDYQYSLKITGDWKKDSLLFHQKKLKEKNIILEFGQLQTDQNGFIECLSISVVFPDLVKGTTSNCKNPISLREYKYALGFKRSHKLFNHGGFEIGYFNLGH